ncbi:MAG TPA: DUF2723 domain-containing protein [Dehalococcoidia bacterium]|nr:DUF2723 domain-containing protein [Dehalococcoidia bacterium]
MATSSRPWQTPGLSRLATLSLRVSQVEVAAALGIFFGVLVVYNATLTPSLSYNSLDGNELATIPSQLGLAHSTGYPFYTWAGKAFSYLPVGDVAHRMNLMSAFGAAGASALLFPVIVMLARGSIPLARRLPDDQRNLVIYGAGAIAALLFAFSTTLWSQAVIAEVYAPNAFMVALSLCLLVAWARREERRPDARKADRGSLGLFGAFALVYGLSLGTHLSNLALAPAFVTYILLTNWRVLLQPQFLGVAVLAFGVGVLQFAWLPYKASQLNDPFLARNTPDDLEGIYNYTLNAFPQFKWAFPLDAIPDRIMLYLDYLLANFYLPGALAALAGAWALLLRHPKAFFLFLVAYVPEMAFFLEYRVQDLDVFYITTHLLVAAVAGYGVFAVTETLLAYRYLSRAGFAMGAALVAIVALTPAWSLAHAWGDNDQSMNTGINDFYEQVFETLPRNATLTGQSGVFGFDMFYFRRVYDTRPDVQVPQENSARLGPQGGRFGGSAQQQANTFTVSPPGSGGFGNFGGGGLSTNAWYVPVIASPVVDADTLTGRRLALYESRPQAPQLFVTNPSPDVVINASFGPVTLLGYDIDTTTVEAGESVHLRLYWQGSFNGRYTVGTSIGDSPYAEAHDLGFGMLNRVQQQNRAGVALVEEYDLVVLSSLETGEHSFSVTLTSGLGAQPQWTEVGRINVR